MKFPWEENKEDSKRLELVLFIGIQASGKSTFYRHYMKQTHELVSKDQLARNSRSRDEQQEKLIREYLSVNRSVVVDNTNPTVKERANIIRIGKEFNALIVGYYFEPTLQDCIQRNSLRTGKSRVPDAALYTTIKKLELPTREEGFDTIVRVKQDPMTLFAINPITD